jgi:signal transduction histidine kinase
MEWLRSYAGAPICVRGETIGFLDVTSAEPGAFGRQHAERLRAFADQAAIALENARLFEQARDSADRLQAMSQRLVEAQETERRHIAQELHDEIGQIVTGLKLRLEMSSQLPDSALRDTLSEAERLVQELLERVRALSLDLRPAMLDDLGLVPALLWLVERFAAQAKVEVAFKHNGVEHRRFSPEVETAAYRIVQEALTNVARHANASAVTVRLWATQDTLGMQVADDGVGFNPEMALTRGTSTGLSSMRERAVLLGGNLEIESSSGMGTRLTAELPLDNAT